MMNIDQARSGEGVVKQPGLLSPKKKKPEPGVTQPQTEMGDSPGITEPVFSGEEHDLNIEIPSGWRVNR
jgi:hypothetical protein